MRVQRVAEIMARAKSGKGSNSPAVGVSQNYADSTAESGLHEREDVSRSVSVLTPTSTPMTPIQPHFETESTVQIIIEEPVASVVAPITEEPIILVTPTVAQAEPTEHVHTSPTPSDNVADFEEQERVAAAEAEQEERDRAEHAQTQAETNAEAETALQESPTTLIAEPHHVEHVEPVHVEPVHVGVAHEEHVHTQAAMEEPAHVEAAHEKHIEATHEEPAIEVSQSASVPVVQETAVAEEEEEFGGFGNTDAAPPAASLAHAQEQTEVKKTARYSFNPFDGAAVNVPALWSQLEAEHATSHKSGAAEQALWAKLLLSS